MADDRAVIGAFDFAVARYHEGGMEREKICRMLKLHPRDCDEIIERYHARVTAYRRAVSALPLKPRRWVS